VPKFIDPVFAKTSPKRSFSMTENKRLGLVFAKTGSIISGTGLLKSLKIPPQFSLYLSIYIWGREQEFASCLRSGSSNKNILTGTCFHVIHRSMKAVLETHDIGRDHRGLKGISKNIEQFNKNND
jgi:hypothetical protein